MTFQIRSTAFHHEATIPVQYTCDGDNRSPSLSWSGIPQGVKSMALICDDPDAPTPQPWVHWVLYNIPPGVSGLGAGCAMVPFAMGDGNAPGAVPPGWSLCPKEIPVG